MKYLKIFEDFNDLKYDIETVLLEINDSPNIHNLLVQTSYPEYGVYVITAENNGVSDINEQYKKIEKAISRLNLSLEYACIRRLKDEDDTEIFGYVTIFANMLKSQKAKQMVTLSTDLIWSVNKA